MKQTESAVINMQLDTEKVEISINKIGNSLTGLKETIASVGNEFSDILSTIQMNADTSRACSKQKSGQSRK